MTLLERKEGNRSFEITPKPISIFISWSGEKSKQIALLLKKFLETTNDFFRPWVSNADIDAGGDWLQELRENLKKAHFGILVCTQESKDKPWLLYEAGVLSSVLQWKKVVPILVDINEGDLPGPLQCFQAIRITKNELKELFEQVNKAHFDNEAAILSVLMENFDRNYEDFYEKYNKQLH